MRLPQDPDNWTGDHAEKAVTAAWRLFEVYEAKYDADKPELTNDLYLQVSHACEEARGVIAVTGWVPSRPLPI